MEYYIEKNDGELSEALPCFHSSSQHSTVVSKNVFNNGNRNSKSKNKKKAKSVDKYGFIIESYKQLKQIENFALPETSKCDLSNNNVKTNNYSKFNLFNESEKCFPSAPIEKRTIQNDFSFSNINRQYPTGFIQFKENSNGEEKQVPPVNHDVTHEDKKEAKQVVTNKTLSSVVYSQITKGGKANDQAVIRAIKEKGPGGMDELFSNVKLKNTSKSHNDENLIMPIFEGKIEQDPAKLNALKQKEEPPEEPPKPIKPDKNQATQSVFSKHTDKNEKTVASEIKEKGAKGVDDLFADMKKKNHK